MIHNDKNLDAAFVAYKKISAQIDGPLIDLQNTVNPKKFNKFIEKLLLDVDKINEKINNFKPNGKASLFRKQVNHFQELTTKLNSLRSDLKLPYMLYVIGMGKAGKSSVLNSLIGDNVADIGTLPKTWKTDLFYKSDTPNNSVQIRYRNGSTEEFAFNDAKDLIESEENKRKLSERKLRDEFKELSKNIDTIQEKEILRQELRGEFLYRSLVKEVRWPLNNIKKNSVLQKFTLIDTPGLSQAHSGTDGSEDIKGEDISDFYYQADGVLWVLDATTLSANTPKEVLDNLVESLAQVSIGEKDGINNIIAVLNHADKVITQGGEAELIKVVKSAKSIFGNKFLEIVPYSAKQALSALESNNQELLERSGYLRLCEVINKHFYSNAVNSRIFSKAQGLKGEIHTYQQEFFDSYLERLKVDNKNLLLRNKEVIDELSALDKNLLSQWEVQFSEYKKEVKNNINAHASELVDLPENQHGDFIQKKVFNLKALDDYQSRYYEMSLKKISDIISRYQKRDMNQFSEYKYIKRKALDINNIGTTDINTNLLQSIDLSSVTSTNMMLGGGAAILGMALLGPIGIAAGLLGMLFGSSKEKKVIDSLNKRLESLEEDCMKRTETFKNNLLSKLDDSLQYSVISEWEKTHANINQTEDIIHIFKELDSVNQKEFKKESFSRLLMSRD